MPRLSESSGGARIWDMGAGRSTIFGHLALNGDGSLPCLYRDFGAMYQPPISDYV